ncbi:MAG: hypothetical protein L3K08_04365 [Thermoplasmata archaeon]|nr:hypothetical protein [Thermoplasmata archaeon]
MRSTRPGSRGFGLPSTSGSTAALLMPILFLLATFPSATVSGAPVAPHAGPPPPQLSINLRETGLPAKSTWFVIIQNQQVTVKNSTLTVPEKPGPYVVLFQNVGEYQPNQTVVNLFVGPRPAWANVTYVLNTSLFMPPDDNNNASPPTGLFGLPPSEGYFVVVVIVLGVLALVSVILIKRPGRFRRSPPVPDSGKEDSEAESEEEVPVRARPKSRPTRDDRRRTQRRRERRDAPKEDPSEEE